MRLTSRAIIALAIVSITAVGMVASDNNDLAWQYVNKQRIHLATPDRFDYSDEFYYQNYLTSLNARDEMPWGKSIPELEFEHFVLPVRVNNENLDTARMVFSRELKDRVKNLSMEDAILEVNHWCHEKVSYRPSDARTSSPLATMRTAYGRCGEESTFLVAALRSVCIPARQVYTPRWAHTDDNHAWVEAWANGKWYFLGACEPEPVLNLGWFNESASRGMLMHTKVAGGRYHGPEEVMSHNKYYTEINVTNNYAPTALRYIDVTDKRGNDVPDAIVEFKLYNYAEFYTVAKKNTSDPPPLYLSAGKGDLLVWVTKDDKVAVKKVSWAGDSVDFASIKLLDESLPKYLEFDIVPPPSSAVLPEVTDDQRAINDRRKAQEDSIRQAYEATMPVEAWRGNYRTIQQFLDEAQNKMMAQKLLDVISAKDLRDINLDVLRDNEVAVTDTSELYCRYVLCPRVENEWLTPYKAFFRQEFEGKVKNIIQLIDWTKENIYITNWRNPQHLRQQPMSVYRIHETDELGRAIFFVSVARSMGWPSRINEVNGKLEYYLNYAWHEVKFDEEISLKTEPSGTLQLNFTPSDTHNDLAYYTHFTLSKLVKNSPQLLTYPEDATWSNTFKDGVNLEPGTYILTTGNRQSDGSVLASITTFKIESNKKCNVDLALRGNDIKVEIIGKIDTKGKYRDINDNTIKDLFNKNGFTIVGYIRPNHEPSNHALRDIATYAKDFEDINCSIVLINHWKQPFNSTEFNNLPATTKWGTIDKDLDFLWKVADKMGIDGRTDPIFLLCDKDGNVYFIKEGYTIHLGEQLLKTIKKIEASRKN